MSVTVHDSELRDDLVVTGRPQTAPDPSGVVGEAINAIRFLSVDAVEKAQSGHPGTPMALAPLAYRLYTRYLRHDPADPAWIDRDRFILSAGLSRQGLPTLDPELLDVAGGASVVAPGDAAAIVATGSEVELALAARDLLATEGIGVRVVSMSCCELFRAQPQAARDALLPPGMPKLAVEAAAPTGWHEFVDDVVGLRRFGASAPGPVVYRELGFTAENVADHVRRLMSDASTKSSDSKGSRP